MPKIFNIILLFYSYTTVAQVPEYYSSIDFNQNGALVMGQLSELILNTHHTNISYTSSSTDTWDIIRMSDLEFENSSDVLLIYGYNDDDGQFITDRTRYKYDTCHTNSCIGLWNREHVFARSLANPNLTTFEPGPGTDVHNLRAADSQKNTQRSNRLFTDGNGNSTIIDNNFYPGDEWKGDVARIIMYMYLRYPGQCEATDTAIGSITYAPENDMSLPLDTHHINMQCHALDNYHGIHHKNELHNLLTLCRKCHQAVHKNEKLATLKLYQVCEDGTVNRLRNQCPVSDCGPGHRLAVHHDRLYCGFCNKSI